MLKKFIIKIKNKLKFSKLDSFNNEEKDNEDSLYNAMIIALIIGIFVVILSLIFLRPEPEYFTELYYTNHKELPFSVNPDEEYFVNITIANHEKNDTLYYLKTIIIYDNKSELINSSEVLVKKEQSINLTIPYKIPNFKKAKVLTQIKTDQNNSEQDIHFYVYNKKIIYQYPEYIALVDCVPKINASGLLLINASGNQSNLRVRKNGVEEFFALVEEKELYYTGIEVNENDLIDIVFDNDFGNSTFDRNLYIHGIYIGDKKLKTPYLADLGKEKDSVDCENLRNITISLPWNAALRFRA